MIKTRDRRSRPDRYDLMTDPRSRPDDSIDVRLLARQDLPHEAFPGGRNEGFRVFFTPEVHAALWKHAGEDTSVEICGVLVGSWHRDEIGPFVKIVESIRGRRGRDPVRRGDLHPPDLGQDQRRDGHEVRSPVDRRLVPHAPGFRDLPLRSRPVHPGAFLLRARPGRPCDRPDPPDRGGVRLAGWQARSEPSISGSATGSWPDRPPARRDTPRRRRIPAQAHRAPADRRPRARPKAEPRINPSGLSASSAARSAHDLWRFLPGGLSPGQHPVVMGTPTIRRDVLASNGFVAVLRLGLADELDRLRGDLAAIARPLEAIQSKTEKPDESLAEIRAQLTRAARRTAAIKAQIRQYGRRGRPAPAPAA